MSRFTCAALFLLGSTVVLLQGCGCNDGPLVGEDCYTADEQAEPLTCKEEGHDCLKSDGSKCTKSDTAGCTCKASQPALGEKCHTRDPLAEPLTCSGELNKCLADDGTPCMQSHVSGCTCKPDCTAALTHDQCLANEHCKWKQQKTRRGLHETESCSEETETHCHKFSSREQCLRATNSACMWVAQNRRRRLQGKKKGKQEEGCKKNTSKSGAKRKACTQDSDCADTEVCGIPDDEIASNKVTSRVCTERACSTARDCEDFLGRACLSPKLVLCKQSETGCTCRAGVQLNELCVNKYGDVQECKFGKCISSATHQLCANAMTHEEKKDCVCKIIKLKEGDGCGVALAGDYSRLRPCDGELHCVSKGYVDCFSLAEESKSSIWKKSHSVKCSCQTGIEDGQQCTALDAKITQRCQNDASRCLAAESPFCKEGETCTCKNFSVVINTYTKERDAGFDGLRIFTQSKIYKEFLNKCINFPDDVPTQAQSPFIGCLSANHNNDREAQFRRYQNAQTWGGVDVHVNSQWITYILVNKAEQETRETYFFSSIPGGYKMGAFQEVTIPLHSELVRLLHFTSVLNTRYKSASYTLRRVEVGGGSSPCYDCANKKIVAFYGELSRHFPNDFQTSYSFDRVYVPRIDKKVPELFSTWVLTILHVHIRALAHSELPRASAFLQEIPQRECKTLHKYATEAAKIKSESITEAILEEKAIENNNSLNTGCLKLTSASWEALHDDVNNLKDKDKKLSSKELKIITYKWLQLMYDCVGPDNLKRYMNQIVEESVKTKMIRGKNFGKYFFKEI